MLARTFAPVYSACLTDRGLTACGTPWHAQSPLPCIQRLGFHLGDARNHRRISRYATLPRKTTAGGPPFEHVHRCCCCTCEIESRECLIFVVVFGGNLNVA